MASCVRTLAAGLAALEVLTAAYRRVEQKRRSSRREGRAGG
jgi:hypothetical protein